MASAQVRPFPNAELSDRLLAGTRPQYDLVGGPDRSPSSIPGMVACVHALDKSCVRPIVQNWASPRDAYAHEPPRTGIRSYLFHNAHTHSAQARVHRHSHFCECKCLSSSCLKTCSTQVKRLWEMGFGDANTHAKLISENSSIPKSTWYQLTRCYRDPKVMESKCSLHRLFDTRLQCQATECDKRYWPKGLTSLLPNYWRDMRTGTCFAGNGAHISGLTPKYGAAIKARETCVQKVLQQRLADPKFQKIASTPPKEGESRPIEAHYIAACVHVEHSG